MIFAPAFELLRCRLLRRALQAKVRQAVNALIARLASGTPLDPEQSSAVVAQLHLVDAVDLAVLNATEGLFSETNGVRFTYRRWRRSFAAGGRV